MIFETRCAGCGKPGAPVCRTCRFALLGPAPRDASHGVIAAVAFTGRARRVVLGWKYRNRRSVSRHLAGLIVNRLLAVRAQHDLDIVTWAPTSRKRRRERGFDQGEFLARAVARQLGLPCRRLLDRDASASQTVSFPRGTPGRVDVCGAAWARRRPGPGRRRRRHDRLDAHGGCRGTP